MKYVSRKISTGSYDFTKWLYGGYEKGIITMFVGPPGSGKTNFVLLCACSQVRKGKRVLFIDTEGGFSIDRVRQILGEDYKHFLENIILFEPRSFSEQKESFKQLLNHFKKESIDLVVVDSIAMLYRLKIGGVDVSKEEASLVNKEVASQMRSLSQIARDKDIPILITNQVYNEFLSLEELKKGIKKEVRFVGGDLFKYWSKCIIELRFEREKRTAFLFKHRSLNHKTLSFEIRDTGLFRKGWI